MVSGQVRVMTSKLRRLFMESDIRLTAPEEVHGSPCDFPEKIEAYLGGLTSSLKDALVLFLLAG